MGPIREEVNPEAGGGGGGDVTPVFEPAPSEHAAPHLPIAPTSKPTEAPPAVEPNKPTEEPAPPAAAPPASAPFSADDLTKGIVEGLKPVIAAQTPQHEPTPEQIAAASNQWDPNAEWLSQLFGVDGEVNPEQQVAAIASMRDGFLRQSLTLANALVTRQLAAFQEQLAPLQSFYEKHSGQQAEQQFFQQYPALKDHVGITKTVAQAMANQEFASNAERIKAIATATEAAIKQYDPNFSLTVASPSPQKPQTPTPPSQPVRGGGGAGGSPSTENKPLTPQGKAVAALKDRP